MGDHFGACRALTRQANPRETADAILNLLNEPGFYARCSVTGQARVEAYYDEETLIHNYRELYSKALAAGLPPSKVCWQPPASGFWL